jgi:hypothetical protein
MLKTKRDKEDIIIRFSKDLLSSEELEKFLNILEISELAKKNNMTKEQAFRLSEKIKEEWWNKNKDSFLSNSPE